MSKTGKTGNHRIRCLGSCFSLELYYPMKYTSS